MGEFIGKQVAHVTQPAGSEQCFAAIVSAVAEVSIDEAHLALCEAGISATDGSTPPPGTRQKVAIGATRLDIEPVGKPFDSEGFMERVNAQFEARKPVALLHKKNDDPTDPRNHWILLAGRYQDNDRTLHIGVMDPLKAKLSEEAVATVESLVERTIEFNGGVFACALSVEPLEPVGPTAEQQTGR